MLAKLRCNDLHVCFIFGRSRARIWIRASTIDVLHGFTQSLQALTKTVHDEGMTASKHVVTNSPCTFTQTFDTMPLAVEKRAQVAYTIMSD